VVAEDVDTVLPAERQWMTATVRFTPDGLHPQLGQTLGVRLVNRNQPDVPGVTGIEVDFDRVRLNVTGAIDPLPPTLLWPFLIGIHP
jgi:hypothetical protein